MDEDRHHDIKQNLDDVRDYTSLYVLFCEGFYLPDEVKTIDQQRKLQILLRRINFCIEKSERILYNPVRFDNKKKSAVKEEKKITSRDTNMVKNRSHINLDNKPRDMVKTNSVSSFFMQMQQLDDKVSKNSSESSSESIVYKTTKLPMKTEKEDFLAEHDGAGSTDDGDQGVSDNLKPPNCPNNQHPVGVNVADETVGSKRKYNSGIDSTSVIDQHDIYQAYFLEIQCFIELEKILTSYRMQHCNDLLQKFIYFSIEDKKNKNVCLFDEIFFILCRCKCVISMWDSIHDPSIHKTSSTDFPFAYKHQVCCESKPIIEYSVKDLVCSIQTLSAKWNHLQYCIDIEKYVDLLMLRTAMLITYTNNGVMHNMPRYRKIVKSQGEGNPEKILCVANQDFIFDMSVYFYSYRKAFMKRRIFNMITLYDMDFLFNHEHSYRIISRIGVDTSKIGLGTKQQEIVYESSIYNQSNASSITCPMSNGNNLLVENDNDNVGKYFGRGNNDVNKSSVLVTAETDSTKNLGYIRDVYQSQVSFAINSMDQMRICYFVNDEVVKFLSNAELSFSILNWLQIRSITLHEYGEETMRLYRKICLNYCVMMGEDMMHKRKTMAGNQTIETVLKTQRGIKVFNKMQEGLNKDPHKILKPLKDVFTGIDNEMKEEKMQTLIKTRDSKLYIEYNKHLLLKNSTVGEKAKRKQQDFFERREERSRCQDHIPKSFEGENTVYQRTDMDIFQTLLTIKLIDAYFSNYFSSSFEEHFVIYEREIEDKYTSYTRSPMPMFVQTFNTFQIYYKGHMYDIGNFICSFYMWLRIVDQFHDRKVCGHDITIIYNDIFKSNKNYNEKCKRSLVEMFSMYKDTSEETQHKGREILENGNKLEQKEKEESNERGNESEITESEPINMHF